MAARQREVAFDPEVLDRVTTDLGDPDDANEVLSLVSAWREARALVAEAVDALESPYREVIEGVYWERATYDELASRLGCGHRSTIMRWKREGEKILRERLENTACQEKWTFFCSGVQRAHAGSRSRG